MGVGELKSGEVGAYRIVCRHDDDNLKVAKTTTAVKSRRTF